MKTKTSFMILKGCSISYYDYDFKRQFSVFTIIMILKGIFSLYYDHDLK